MKKVILFGAGNGGIRIFKLLVDEYAVIAFADNDRAKQGLELLGRPIIAPEGIADHDFDMIIITNLFGKEVRHQLTAELGIPDGKVFDYYRHNFYDTRVGVLRQLADEIYENDIPGSIAEVGVYLGDFAKYINAAFPDRKLYLFDTFEGFMERDVAMDRMRGYSDSRAGDFSNSSVALVLSKMKHPNNCIVKQGRFPETGRDCDDTFALVSLDVDLYQPTYDSLAFFYPRLARGGYILVHDYNNVVYRGVKDAVRAFCREYGASYVPLCDIGGTAIVCR